VWENNIKLNVSEMGIGGVNCIWMAENRVRWRAFVNTIMNLRVPERKQATLCKADNKQLFEGYPSPRS
jgi:hypothetical protein